MSSKREFDEQRLYQFRIYGHLGKQWKVWFDGFDISTEEQGITVLTGRVNDQPQLHGLLLKIRDLGLSLISVNEIKKE